MNSKSELFSNESAEEFYRKSFDEQMKAKCFDKLASMFYDKNFSTASKADIDLLMFKFFMDAMIQENKDAERSTIDYAACSDYKMSQKLGITQQRVRNFKIKAELVYPREDFDWQESLAKLLRDEKRVWIENGRILVGIPDPNLYYAIQDYVEDQGGYVNIHLNPKLMDMRWQYYIQLAVSLEGGENQKEIYKRLKKRIKEQSKNDITVSKDNIAILLLRFGINATDIVKEVMELLNPLTVITSSVISVLKNNFKLEEFS